MNYSIAVRFSTLALLSTKQFTVPITCILHFIFIQVDPNGCSFLLANWFTNREEWLKWHTLQTFIDILAQAAVFYSSGLWRSVCYVWDRTCYICFWEGNAM